MRANVFRPFGIKNGVDFDKVDRELIAPALSALSVSGATRSMPEISEGAITAEFFESLTAADLVVADMSFATPECCYLLGLAHGLRSKRTVVIRAEGQPSALLSLTRTFIYDAERPASSVPALVSRLSESISSDKPDSPAYLFLPDLKAPEAHSTPADFRAEVKRAKERRDLGLLRLLSSEVRFCHFAAEALLSIGEEQFFLRDFQGACETLEHVTQIRRDHVKANLLLGTLYQRLRQPARSSQAIERALTSPELDTGHRAEAFALMGRNAKTSWTETWWDEPEAERPVEALRCDFLQEAWNHYRRAFLQDLNSFYAGLNALALGRIISRLAADLPEDWAALFAEDEDAARRKAEIERHTESIESAVHLALDSARERAPDDFWIAVSLADFAVLTSTRPRAVAESYRRALASAPPFVHDSVRTQLMLYRRLGVFRENVDAALGVVGEGDPASTPSTVGARRSAILFAGHAIDPTGRFPADREQAARAAILSAVQSATQDGSRSFVGIAGGSSGGDIVFHEVCGSLSIPSTVCLPVPPPDHIRFGVAPAGPEWETRFRDLLAHRPYTVLSDSAALPRWLASAGIYESFRHRDNMWRYHSAAAIGDVTFIALWNGQSGSVADLVDKAKSRGASIIILSTQEVFGTPTVSSNT